MELRHLRCFVAVAEELHFHRAADRLYLSQPAVSEQIRKLESSLGCRLLERSRRTVELTPAGASLLDDARAMLRLAEAAEQSARRAEIGAFSRLRVGYVPEGAPPTLFAALGRVRGAIRELDISLQAGSTDDLLADVTQSRLDAAVVALPADVHGLRAAEIGFEHVIVTGHADAADPVRLATLTDRPLLVLDRDRNRPFHDMLVGELRGLRAATPATVVTVPNVEHALLETAAGNGVALLPQSAAARVGASGAAFAPLADAGIGTVQAVVTRDETPSTTTAAFLRGLSLSVSRARRLAPVAA
jgi:DNA-binding transcriptional LysR family regulator